jgi:hypothetical protein
LKGEAETVYGAEVRDSVLSRVWRNVLVVVRRLVQPEIGALLSEDEEYRLQAS